MFSLPPDSELTLVLPTRQLMLEHAHHGHVLAERNVTLKQVVVYTLMAWVNVMDEVSHATGLAYNPSDAVIDVILTDFCEHLGRPSISHWDTIQLLEGLCHEIYPTLNRLCTRALGDRSFEECLVLDWLGNDLLVRLKTYPSESH